MDCLAYCKTSSYRIKPLFDFLRTKYNPTLFRDVIHLEITDQSSPGHVFIFPYGAVVTWGLSKNHDLKLLEEFNHFEVDKLETEFDEFTYIYGDLPKIVEDEIVLPNKEVLTKLAFSHGIAQSVKLGTFETAIKKTFEQNQEIPQELAKRGHIELSRTEIRKKMGRLFLERSSINLHADVLDLPEFFWEYPELEPYYRLIANYLDVQTRVEVLNKRLDVIHELFDMLNNELNHQHSSRLELVIILLIVMEVVLTLLKDVFHIL